MEMKTVLNSDDNFFIDLVEKMLMYNPTKRLSVVQALMHPYFDDVPDAIRELCWPKGLAT